jgi:hypothetical protein
MRGGFFFGLGSGIEQAKFVVRGGGDQGGKFYPLSSQATFHNRQLDTLSPPQPQQSERFLTSPLPSEPF